MTDDELLLMQAKPSWQTPEMKDYEARPMRNKDWALAPVLQEKPPITFTTPFAEPGGATGRAGESLSQIHAFTLIGTSDGIRVTYGTVAGMVPSGFSPGDNPPFVITSPGTENKAYLHVSVDSNDAVQDVAVEFNSSVPGDAYPNFYRELGSWSTDGDGKRHVTSALSGSQEFELCGGISALWGLV